MKSIWGFSVKYYFLAAFLFFKTPVLRADKSYTYLNLKRLGFDVEEVFSALLGQNKFYGTCELYNGNAHVFHGNTAGDCLVENLWQSYSDNSFSGVLDVRLNLSRKDPNQKLNLKQLKIFWRPAVIQDESHAEFNRVMTMLMPQWRFQEDILSLGRLKRQYLEHKLKIVFLTPSLVSEIYGADLWARILFGKNENFLISLDINSIALKERKLEDSHEVWTMQSDVDFNLFDLNKIESNISLKVKSDFKISPFKTRSVEWELEGVGG
ncbi:MAG: hypothetical protein KA116_01595 [Proteobacteria bacterium]|nr:hypothetical protein [Pseudomonadota bacterium]